MWAFVALTLPLVGESLVAVAVEMLASAGVYVLTFLFFGVSPTERRFYFGKVAELLIRRRLAVTLSEGA